jgi:ubiquinone/menaquinone biosynthesis C-methylase UbiE
MGSKIQLALQPDICDYEGSTYRTDFWTQERTYENAVERVAMRAMLPPSGRRLVEIGAGFGRWADMYAGYDQVVLFDYSRSLLQEARARLGDSGPSGRPQYIYVAGDFYALPFAAGVFDTVTMVRVIHHAQDVPRVLRGISEIVAPGGIFVLEFANKRNLKAILRWLFNRQDWNPFAQAPLEFAALNFDFHPRWMHTRLAEAGFKTETIRSVSHLRLNWLKKVIPTHWLVQFDRLAQPSGRWWQLTPSVFVKSQATRHKPAAGGSVFFRCPKCYNIELLETTSHLRCSKCQSCWPIQDGLYDLRKDACPGD